MRKILVSFYKSTLFIGILTLCSCGQQPAKPQEIADVEPVKYQPKPIIIEKELLYDQHVLADTYPYKDTVREFQWEKIRSYLALVDSMQIQPASWGILQNHKDETDMPPLAKSHRIDDYKAVTDDFGVEQYQGTPLYELADSITPARYGMDGSLVKIEKKISKKFLQISGVYFEGTWLAPKKYIYPIEDTVVFNKIVFVDRTNQNICTLEKSGEKWLIRSMNPATTGLHHPPVMRATPIGIFVIQEKKAKMIYLTDDGSRVGGFAPYANRFCNGGYIHGVPVNAPHTEIVEFSPTLGTTPRSHMCVRNASSHAKFIYNWAPVEGSLVIVFD